MNAADLLAMGCKIRTRHLRFYTPIDNKTRVMDTIPPAQFVGKARAKHPPFPRGGITEVQVTFPNGRTVVGHAWCSPKDNYDRRAGKERAVENAVLLALQKEPENG